MRKNISNKGSTLINALVFSLVLVILGAAIAYITQTGYFSISAEEKYQIAEKNANKALLQAIEEIYNGTRICNGTETISFSSGEAEIRFVPDENDQNCFIWVKGIFKNSKVIKVVAISSGNGYWAAAVFRNLNSLYIKSHADIISCNDTYQTPALITGNNVTSISYGNCYTSADVRAWVDEPYKVSPELLESPVYLTNTVFKNASNRTDIFNILSQNYGVAFDNGTPYGFIEADENVWNGTQYGVTTCTATDTTIKCNNGTITITYNPDTGNFTIGSEEYEAIDLGNASLTINSFFGNETKKAKIAAGNVTFEGNATNIILVAKEKIEISNSTKGGKKDIMHVSITNSTLFTKDYDIFVPHFDYEGGILYSSGSGYLKLRSHDSTIGTPDNPTLIIADNQLDIDGRCHTDIYGLVYITEATSNFDLDERGHFEIHGAIISNSLSNSLSMRCHTTIEFDPDVIIKLSDNLGFIKKPINSSLRRYQLITTKIEIY